MTNTCLACGSDELSEVLNFGPQAAANLLAAGPDEPTRRETLALLFCNACGHAQQKSFYPAEELFSHYLYQSGTSKTLADYFDWYANAISRAVGSDAKCLEIASNDGSFIRAMSKIGMSCSGVEPASNLVAHCREEGLEVLEGFWPNTKPEGKFDVITAQNVAAHTPDPFGFMKGIAETLASDGVALVQASQLDMFSNFEFDTLYHEHYSFYSPSSMAALAKRSGLPCARFVRTNIHGGSLLGIFGRDEARVEAAQQAFMEGEFSVSKVQADQRVSKETAQAFGSRANQTNRSLITAADLARSAGYKVVVVGAAAKAITILQTSGLKPDYVVDEAPMKIGLYVPGTPFRIDPLTEVSKIDGPCLFVMGAWNFQAELSRKISEIRDEPNDKVLCYFPQFSLRSLEG